MKVPFRRPGRALALVAAAALAGCGGGGSSSSTTPTETAPITEATYLSYATPMGRSVVGLNSGTSAVGGAGDGTATGASAHSMLALAQQARLAGRAVAMSATARRQASQTFSDACAFGGTVSGTVSYANATTITSGDSVSLNFTNCLEESAGTPLNGSMSLRFNAFTENPLSMDASGSFTNFSAGMPALNGSYHLKVSESGSTDTVEMRFSGMKIGSDPTTFDTTLAGSFSSNGNATFSIGGSITTSSGHYTLTQLSPFTASGGDPVSGTLRLADNDGNAVEMTANGNGSVSFAYYPKGATTPTATSSSFSWAQFKQ